MWMKNCAIPAAPKKQTYKKILAKKRKELMKKIKNARAEFDRLQTVSTRLAYLYLKSEDGEMKFSNSYGNLRTAWVPTVVGLCDVCNEEKAYCKHHIIPLCKGGNNSDDNLINICLTCHKAVHPFMEGSSKFDCPDIDRAVIEDKRMQEIYIVTKLVRRKDNI